MTHPCRTCGHEQSAPNPTYYRALREQAGLSQADMARACGVTQGHVSDMELGERTFTPEHAETYERVWRRYTQAGGA